MSVAVRELKSTLSRTLARAQAGEVIEVTSHNKPIARIVGIPRLATDGMRAMISGGALCWGGGKPSLAPPLELASAGMPVSRMVLEDRS